MPEPTIVYERSIALVLRYPPREPREWKSASFTAHVKYHRPIRFASMREALWFVDVMMTNHRRRRAQRRARRITRQHKKFRR